MTSTFDRLSANLVKNYEIASEDVTADANFASLNMDSLDVTELLFSIEEEFNVTFSSEPQQLPTVGHLVRYVDHLITAQDARDSKIDSMRRALQTS